jgi:hypothetical protein
MTDLQEPVAGPREFHCEQLSHEWWTLRRGIPTASCFDRILTPAKGQPSAQQDDYIAELISERSEFLPPYVAPSGGFTTDEMAEGLRREPEARSWYALQTDGEVRQVGFVLSACGRFGCSPDALVGDDGVLELKNPAAKTHVRYLMRGGLPVEYRCQVHGALIVTGRKWADFMSYSPGLAPLLVRVVPDEFTDLLRAELDRFHAKYRAAVDRIAAL